MQIKDWKSFHLLCKEKFGFPDFYGMNMNAWIDCLTYLDESDGMSRFPLAEEKYCILTFPIPRILILVCRRYLMLLSKAVLSANRRYADEGKSPVLALVFL